MKKHLIRIRKEDGNTVATCRCGKFYVEFTGYDESSKSAAKSAGLKHDLEAP